MNAHAPRPKVDLDDFRFRATDCETCGGEGTQVEFHRFAGEYMAGEPVEVTCLDCDGTGEQEAMCAECGEERKLNDDGVCQDCAFALTEVSGDPLKGLAA